MHPPVVSEGVSTLAVVCPDLRPQYGQLAFLPGFGRPFAARFLAAAALRALAVFSLLSRGIRPASSSSISTAHAAPVFACALQTSSSSVTVALQA